ncbi:hypothetical protein [Pseudoponticoccus marisrubri]|uniref:DUF3329 domain-containing protein n=1 Tax=Pseudoponticoccus marisrubri TaxID=1685382 RepID=A0A0W7WFM4_9RHOB|nr:hypothetical protein [Pseudoponticoccus marisrubri]KUF09327.1 hypothetical protein AVJ23_17950 [Pseudoponticoccus marisrubri]
MNSAFNVQLAIFKPLWRRVAVVALCIGWALLEVLHGNLFWAMIFGAIGLYCCHQFFIAFDPPEDDED